VPTPFQPQVPKPRHCASAPPRLIEHKKLIFFFEKLKSLHRMAGENAMVQAEISFAKRET
jgi:hypothetical protein